MADEILEVSELDEVAAAKDDDVEAHTLDEVSEVAEAAELDELS